MDRKGVDRRVLDRRVQRTRAALIEALLQIVRESGWRSATVRAITARANVGRTTFYENFDDREHLLNTCIDEMLMSFRPTDGAGFNIDAMASHVLEAKLDNFFEIPQFRRAVADAVVASLARTTSPTAARFVAGGLLAIAEQAGDQAKSTSRPELSELISTGLAVGGKARTKRAR